MPENLLHSKLPHTVFAFFVWQTDLVREISAAEAEEFFRLLEVDDASLGAALRTELLHTYPKLWREYVKLGPPPPLELSLMTHGLEDEVRASMVKLLAALNRVASASKRKLSRRLSAALVRLLNHDDSVLKDLQDCFQKSRFFESRLKPVAPAPAEPVVKPAAATAEVKSVSVAVAEPVAPIGQVTETAIGTSQSTISVLKMVPWSEHDAVDPEKLRFWTKGARAMRCIGIIDRSHDFKSFQFMSEEPTLFFFKPGQFVTLELMVEGKRALRSYTISSSPSRPHLIEISVKRVKNGLVSNYLHDKLNIGDTVTMKPPGGKFHCFDTVTDKYLFLSAGSGITPMLSMARWWHDTGAHPDVIFFHSVREPEDAVFAEDMMTFTSANRNFHYMTSFTSSTLPENWPGMKGRFSEEKLLRIAPDFQERMIFSCGPDSFMKNVRLLLEKHNFPIKERFRQESFGTPSAFKEAPAASAAAAPSAIPLPVTPRVQPAAPKTAANEQIVHFSLSALEVFGGDMDVPILDLAEEVGVEIPSSCRSGTCGTCRAMKIKGEVECDDTPGLTDADREAGYILTCVSRAKSYVEIEI